MSKEWSKSKWLAWQKSVIREELAELKQEKSNKSPKYSIRQDAGEQKENA